MSDTLLKLIPTDPGFVPAEENQSKAKHLLDIIFGDDKVELIEADDIEFIDQGENFENITCNLCGQEIDIDWWQDAVDEALARQQLVVETPCCHQKNSLNELNYNWPAGFARFSMVINNPAEDINDQQLSELEQQLAASVRKIWTRY